MNQTPLWWEIAKGILLFTTTATLAYVARTLGQVLKGMQTLQFIVVGVDGTNGLRSKVSALGTRVDAIEGKAIAAEAVREERRTTTRRRS